MKLGKYSFGVGDRFAHQGKAQLRAIMRANENGLDICPVWNKSNREHIYVHSHPSDVRREADAAVAALGFTGKYFVDADHINLSTVEPFIETADFFTLDVAAFIGKPSSEADVAAFVASCGKYLGDLKIPGIEAPVHVTEALLREVAGKFLAAIRQASEIHARLVTRKGRDGFITEVSMDEVESPQTPVDMLFILKMIADAGIPAQTIAPKFTGRFNKGVDYRGDLRQFAREFEDDVRVIDFAIREFGLPEGLKLSVHSGSDKFSIYPIMGEIVKRHGRGLHVKTAGTTWLEEVIGLAKAGGDGLVLAGEIYARAYGEREALCAPYLDVIDIDAAKLPSVEEVGRWSSERFVGALRHVPDNPEYDANFRQLIHVAYKVAADMGEKYLSMLEKYSGIIGQCVEENIYERHLKRLFGL
ncbi:MAG: tagaturonate epimerase family protein [Candidatus Accumulibacter sp.]|jgi:hypothetical protein|nr:tagaturonate epimerase family protein [Accumulibacter sp.]